MAKPAVYTNEKRIAVPFNVLVEKWPAICKEIRQARLVEMEALVRLGYTPGPETWNELVESSGGAIEFEYDDEWTSYVGVTAETGVGAEVGLVVGPVDAAFRWSTKRQTREALSSLTRLRFKALLGTTTPRLTEALMAEVTRGSTSEDLTKVAVEIAKALAGVAPQGPVG